MAKFKVGDEVLLKEGNQSESGRVIAVEKSCEGNKCDVKYLVTFGGIETAKVYGRKDLVRLPKNKEVDDPFLYKSYKAENGVVLTFAAIVKKESDFEIIPGLEYGDDRLFEHKRKVLTIGFSIYNGIDKFDGPFGMKIARNRALNSPFCRLESNFMCEFGVDTIFAIMDAKAKYVKEHLDSFLSKEA